jgi:Zn-dependent peptidase ImmA (M78 family)/DNA-binding XRE family transcriptional regulator
MKRGTLGFNGDRLREAREARGLTATSLADLIGVSRQAISQYENGVQSPRPEIADEIVRVLKLPIDFFSRPARSEEPRKIFYRSMSAATKSARARMAHRNDWLADIVDYLREFIELPDVNFPSFRLRQNPREISPDDIEFLAAETRKYWGLGEGPIENVVALLENNGAIVARSHIGADTLDALSDWYDEQGTPYVFLGADKESAVRSRFDAAHELGHLILHRNIDSKYLTRKADFSLVESHAHRFAGAFLLPASTFANDLYAFNLDVFRTIKTKWKSSIAMMLYRSTDLEFINEEEASRLWRNLSRRGWRLQEPLDDRLPIEQPRLLHKAFELLVNEGVQTRAQIKEALPYSDNDIEDLANLPAGFLSEKTAPVSMLSFKRQQRPSKEQRDAESGEVIGLWDTEGH